MKAHGIYQSTSSIRDTPIPSLKRKLSPTTTTAGAGVKKRKFDKADQFVEMNTNTDDDEDLTKIKPESSRSTAKEGKMKEEKIKEEEIKVEEEAVVVGTSSGSAASIQCPLTKIAKLGSADDALFNDFISFGASSGSAQGNATTSNVSDVFSLTLAGDADENSRRISVVMRRMASLKVSSSQTSQTMLQAMGSVPDPGHQAFFSPNQIVCRSFETAFCQ